MELRDFFVVLIVLGVACFEAEAQQNCGIISHPAHGQVFVQGYKRGDKARFTCDTGYVLHGAEEVQCFGNNMWSGMPPICINPKNIDDIVHSMTSAAEIESRSSWGYGLDVVMIMDTSSNIGPEYHEASKSCMKLLVDIFSNVRERTRFALVTLANTGTVVSNLNDSEATLRESFKQKIDDIQNVGGETMLVSALESFYVDIYRNGSGGVFPILFILTDGNSIQQEDVKLKSFIHEIYGLEVFVLGVGQNINEKALRLIASKPVKKHVFFINEFTNIEAVERYSDWMKIAVPLNAMKEAANRFKVTRYDSHAMVLMVDVSSNISPEYLTAAQYFMKQIVDIFGVVVGISSRFGLVTFADTATVILNVYVDAETLLGEVIKQKIDGVQNTVGGSNLTTAFDLFLQDMYLPVTRFGSESYDIYRLDRKWNIFVFTDGEGITKDDNVRLSSTFKDLQGQGVEIFAMGIGQSINIEAMRSIASKPADKHVFEINAFRNLTKIDGAILEGNSVLSNVADIVDAMKEISESVKGDLNVVMMVQTSYSIGPGYLQAAKYFMTLLVEVLGVSRHRAGVGHRVRFALMKMDEITTVVVNLNHNPARGYNALKKKIAEIQNTFSGMTLLYALDAVSIRIILPFLRDKSTKTIIFVLSDGMETIPTEKRRLDHRRRAIQDFAEIFAVELGQTINQDVLHSLASKPKQEHVFNINGFKDVKDGVVDVANRLIDNGKCGKQHRKELLSGPPKTLIEPTRPSYNYNYVPHRNEMRKGELPWVGWIGARGKLCGGALLCERFFLTAARCVSEFNETTNELVPYPPHEVAVNLGDLNLYENDKHEQTLNPERIILHPYYTGLSNINGIRHHDVAVLDFGKSHVRKPALNSIVKPVCFPYHKLHNVSATLLSDLKQLKPTLALGFTAGWGLMPEHHRQLPWDVLSQSRRSVQSDRVCERLYPGLDTDRFFCVGNFIQEIETCRGDVGGVYMAELPYLGRYTALGVNIRSFDCERDGHFSMFLNLHHPEITGWMESVLGRCNRMGTVEEEEAEAEKERMQNEEAERLAADKARKERERLAAEKVRKEEKERLADEKERG